MRSTLFVLFAAASAASAQIPPVAKPAVKPKPVPAPKVEKVRPWADFQWRFEPPVISTDRFDFPPGKFDFPPGSFDFPLGKFELAPLESIWLDPAPMAKLSFELDHLKAIAPMEWPSLQGVPTPKTQIGPEFSWSPWNDEGDRRGALSRMRPEQGTAEDSLYRAAREALNRGEYSRASTMFRSLEQRYPRSRVAPAVLYWQAFALYRAGSTDELKRALEVLKAQQEKYPEAAADGEAAALRTRLQAALAARGDAQAAAALQAATNGGPTCDKEDVEVRAEALNALAQINLPEARPALKKVLSRRDECSVRLRRSAVYILGRIGSEESTSDLIEVAKTDPDPSVRSDAIMILGRSPGTATVKTLEQLFAASTDDRTRQAVLSALRSRGGPEAKRLLRTIIERNDIPERMRSEAISQLAGSSADIRAATMAMTEGGPPGQTASTASRRTGDDEDSAYLRNLYGKMESQQIKLQIISAVARIGGTANDQWILGIAKNRDEDIRTRREALSRLRSTSLSVDDLGKLFDSLSERDLRSAVLQQLGRREEPAATDKLIEIARSGTDPQLRREAISLLARKNDPRTTKLLLDLVEKP